MVTVSVMVILKNASTHGRMGFGKDHWNGRCLFQAV